MIRCAAIPDFGEACVPAQVVYMPVGKGGAMQMMAQSYLDKNVKQIGTEQIKRGNRENRIKGMEEFLASCEGEAAFLKQAAERDLCTLKGHRSVGGCRASIYNAMPVEGVERLRDFMLEFRDKNAK